MWKIKSEKEIESLSGCTFERTFDSNFILAPIESGMWEEQHIVFRRSIEVIF